MECYKCKKEINEKASFCPNCGTDLSKKDDVVVCTNCKAKNTNGSCFCEKCGTKLKKEKIAWDFDSKVITITFWICAIFTIYLLSCPGFIRTIDFFELSILNIILSFALIGSGIFLLFFLNKDKIDIQKEIDIIKKIKLSKVQIGFLFIIAGVLCLLGLGNQQYGEIYINKVFIVFISFLTMIGVIAYKNFHKLSSTGKIMSSMGQISCLIISIVCFGFSIQQNSYGNELNSSYEHQFESFWNSGTANPGNEYLTNSKYLMIAGIIFLVLFVIITIYKKKKND